MSPIKVDSIYTQGSDACINPLGKKNTFRKVESTTEEKIEAAQVLYKWSEEQLVKLLRPKAHERIKEIVTEWVREHLIAFILYKNWSPYKDIEAALEVEFYPLKFLKYEVPKVVNKERERLWSLYHQACGVGYLTSQIDAYNSIFLAPTKLERSCADDNAWESNYGAKFPNSLTTECDVFDEPVFCKMFQMLAIDPFVNQVLDGDASSLAIEMVTREQEIARIEAKAISTPLPEDDDDDL